MAKAASKAAIEIHLENLIKGHQTLWMGYKRRLLYIHGLLKELELQNELSISEGDSFIRFSSVNDHSGLNSFFFVYEIGSVFPNLRWRHLIGSGQRFNYFLLTKPISCLPAFSFWLDQQTTLIYWGEHVPFLSTIELRNLKLSNFILRSNSPSSVEVSAANLVWPRSAYPLINQEFEQLASDYVFNSLMPPILDGRDEVWFESPFVLIGDKIVSFLTIHKTLCTIDRKSARPISNREVINAKAKLIDRKFTVKSTLVDIPEEYIEEFFEKDYPREVIFVKAIRFKYDPTISVQKPVIRYTIYPFESVKLFCEESFGILLTLASIVLRERYLRSSDPFFFTITPEEFIHYLNKILGSLSSIHINRQLGMRLIENREGLYTLASALGVYASNNSSFAYLHPALFECIPSNLENRITKNNLVQFQRVVSSYSQKAGSIRSFSSVLLLQELFEKELGFIPNYGTASLLRIPIYNLVRKYIPFSKALCLCPEMIRNE